MLLSKPAKPALAIIGMFVPNLKVPSMHWYLNAHWSDFQMVRQIGRKGTKKNLLVDLGRATEEGSRNGYVLD